MTGRAAPALAPALTPALAPHARRRARAHRHRLAAARQETGVVKRVLGRSAARRLVRLRLSSPVTQHVQHSLPATAASETRHHGLLQLR